MNNLGVVSAGDKNTANAAAEILKIGGNAYDAMCAALLAAPLCEPILTSLAGGGFMLCKEVKKEPILYDFFVDVPKKKRDDIEFYPIEVDFGTTTQEFHIGAASIAVPGVLKGIWEVHKELGSLNLDQIIAPAYRYAKEGIYLSKTQADFLKLLTPIFISTKGSRELYMRNGNFIDEKHLYKNEDYASFLEDFAKEGAAIFYKGKIAKELQKLCEEHGGLLDIDTLSKYKVIKREPLAFRYKEYKIYTNPPPSSGGILIAFSLLLLEDKNFTKKDRDYYIHLIESQETTSLFRKEFINEHLHSIAIKDILKDKKLLKRFKKEFESGINLWGNTTHISIIDKDGNCASCTTSNGEGSGYILPHTGIMLNNMLGEEDLNPHGFFKWQSGIRLPSMMAPTILTKDGNIDLVLGSAGSNRIRSAILQTILNYTEFKLPPQDSIDEPRVHYENFTIFLEPPLNIDNIPKRYIVKKFKEKNLFFGGVQAVNSKFEGGADKRRGAYSLVVEHD